MIGAKLGLDVVELVLRTEEVFGIDLSDDERGRVVTVGDFYRLVLSKLNLPYQAGADIESGRLGRDRSSLGFTGLYQWSTPDVWRTLKGVIQHQLQVREDEINEPARFVDDLGAD